MHAADVYNHSASPCGQQISQPGSPLQYLAVNLATKQLHPVHESIIIGTPGFWSLASPAACALRAHFYLRVRSRALVCRVFSLQRFLQGCCKSQIAGRALQATAGSEDMGKEALVQHTADHLVVFALQHETARLPRSANFVGVISVRLAWAFWPSCSRS